MNECDHHTNGLVHFTALQSKIMSQLSVLNIWYFEIYRSS